jgi:hypothetical protein
MFHVDKDPRGRKRIITGGDGCRICVSGFFRTAVLSWWWCKVAKDFVQFLFSSLSLSLSSDNSHHHASLNWACIKSGLLQYLPRSNTEGGEKQESVEHINSEE